MPRGIFRQTLSRPSAVFTAFKIGPRFLKPPSPGKLGPRLQGIKRCRTTTSSIMLSLSTQPTAKQCTSYQGVCLACICQQCISIPLCVQGWQAEPQRHVGTVPAASWLLPEASCPATASPPLSCWSSPQPPASVLRTRCSYFQFGKDKIQIKLTITWQNPKL